MSHIRIRGSLYCALAAGLILLPWASPAQNLSSTSQLRRTIDPSERSASGQVILKIDSKGTQTMEINVKGLGADSFALFNAPFQTFGTDCCTFAVAPMDRTGSTKKGTWSRTITGSGIAPAELQNIGITNLSQLAGTRADVAQPGVNNEILTVTNVVGGITNVIMGIPVPTPNVTNIVETILWAPLYTPTAKPSAGSYFRKNAMILPTVPPSPGAKAQITVKFNGATGESIFDVKASKLSPGQVYHVYLADSTNQTTYLLIDAGTMTASKSGATTRFTRDTKFGDPLPQQARDAGDLSGRIIEIRDDFVDFVHLQGIVP